MMKVSDSSERRANAQLPEWSNGIGCNPIQSGVRISYWAQANNQNNCIMNQNPMEQFERMFREKLEAVKFEAPKSNNDQLFPFWKKLLLVCSLQKLDCDTKTYRSLVEVLDSENPELSLFEISFLINGISKVSAKELEVSPEVYSSLLIYSDELAKIWNDKVLPIRNELLSKLQTQASLNVQQNNKMVNPNMRIH